MKIVERLNTETKKEINCNNFINKNVNKYVNKFKVSSDHELNKLKLNVILSNIPKDENDKPTDNNDNFNNNNKDLNKYLTENSLLSDDDQNDYNNKQYILQLDEEESKNEINELSSRFSEQTLSFMKQRGLNRLTSNITNADDILINKNENIESYIDKFNFNGQILLYSIDLIKFNNSNEMSTQLSNNTIPYRLYNKLINDSKYNKLSIEAKKYLVNEMIGCLVKSKVIQILDNQIEENVIIEGNEFFTFDKLCEMLRSEVPQQRIISMNIISKILIFKDYLFSMSSYLFVEIESYPDSFKSLLSNYRIMIQNIALHISANLIENRTENETIDQSNCLTYSLCNVLIYSYLLDLSTTFPNIILLSISLLSNYQSIYQSNQMKITIVSFLSSYLFSSLDRLIYGDSKYLSNPLSVNGLPYLVNPHMYRSNRMTYEENIRYCNNEYNKYVENKNDGNIGDDLIFKFRWNSILTVISETNLIDQLTNFIRSTNPSIAYSVELSIVCLQLLHDVLTNFDISNNVDICKQISANTFMNNDGLLSSYLSYYIVSCQRNRYISYHLISSNILEVIFTQLSKCDFKDILHSKYCLLFRIIVIDLINYQIDMLDNSLDSQIEKLTHDSIDNKINEYIEEFLLISSKLISLSYDLNACSALSTFDQIMNSYMIYLSSTTPNDLNINLLVITSNINLILTIYISIVNRFVDSNIVIDRHVNSYILLCVSNLMGVPSDNMIKCYYCRSNGFLWTLTNLVDKLNDKSIDQIVTQTNDLIDKLLKWVNKCIESFYNSTIQSNHSVIEKMYEYSAVNVVISLISINKVNKQAVNQMRNYLINYLSNMTFNKTFVSNGLYGYVSNQLNFEILMVIFQFFVLSNDSNSIPLVSLINNMLMLTDVSTNLSSIIQLVVTSFSNYDRVNYLTNRDMMLKIIFPTYNNNLESCGNNRFDCINNDIRNKINEELITPTEGDLSIYVLLCNCILLSNDINNQIIIFDILVDLMHKTIDTVTIVDASFSLFTLLRYVHKLSVYIPTDINNEVVKISSCIERIYILINQKILFSDNKINIYNHLQEYINKSINPSIILPSDNKTSYFLNQLLDNLVFQSFDIDLYLLPIYVLINEYIDWRITEKIWRFINENSLIYILENQKYLSLSIYQLLYSYINNKINSIITSRLARIISITLSSIRSVNDRYSYIYLFGIINLSTYLFDLVSSNGNFIYGLKYRLLFDLKNQLEDMGIYSEQVLIDTINVTLILKAIINLTICKDISSIVQYIEKIYFQWINVDENPINKDILSAYSVQSLNNQTLTLAEFMKLNKDNQK